VTKYNCGRFLAIWPPSGTKFGRFLALHSAAACTKTGRFIEPKAAAFWYKFGRFIAQNSAACLYKNRPIY
jgi:hypothetical protein